MYAVRLNDDKSVTTVVNQRIEIGYQASDWFWFWIKPKFQNKNVANSVVTIEFKLPQSGKTKVETLVAKNEYYDEYLKFALAKYSKLTIENGWVEIQIVVTDDDGAVKSDIFKVGISSSEDFHDDKNYDNPTLDGSGYDPKGCDCDHEQLLADVMEKIKPLVFNSTESAEAYLNDDETPNIYLGQTVIVISEGKYLLYSVQQGTTENTFIVEPVDTDTVGEVIWKDDDDSNNSEPESVGFQEDEFND